jgi:hypothetical protein
MKKDEMCGKFSTHGTKGGTYRVFVGKPERNGALGRPRYR